MLNGETGAAVFFDLRILFFITFFAITTPDIIKNKSPAIGVPLGLTL
jgi:hypothetical protein